ncbi:MAG: hypothetical protein N5P05_004389 (plasmid) [Chroococcopsis gigantea SAG 12.99]|nr:hypothetical protein [Chroococcopsis gigantea SAG 12.99]
MGNGPGSVILKDMNGDSKLDILVTNQFDNTVSLLLGNGDGTFGGEREFLVGSRPRALFVGDFNGDSKLDFITANSWSNDLTISLNSVSGGSRTTQKVYTYDPVFNKVTLCTGQKIGVGLAKLTRKGFHRKLRHNSLKPYEPD